MLLWQKIGRAGHLFPQEAPDELRAIGFGFSRPGQTYIVTLVCVEYYHDFSFVASKFGLCSCPSDYFTAVTSSAFALLLEIILDPRIPRAQRFR